VAFTYYAHRAKMELVGLGGDYVEQLNRKALELAKEAAREVEKESGRQILVAGDVCNTTVFDPADPAPVRAMFDEQIGWAKAAGVDFIVCETFETYAEARRYSVGGAVLHRRRCLSTWRALLRLRRRCWRCSVARRPACPQATRRPRSIDATGLACNGCSRAPRSRQLLLGRALVQDERRCGA
jgi:hypothetical protein